MVAFCLLSMTREFQHYYYSLILPSLRKCLEKAVVDLRMKVECISMFQAPMKMYTRIAKIFDSFQA